VDYGRRFCGNIQLQVEPDYLFSVFSQKLFYFRAILRKSYILLSG
jgi:hypothetical protein